MKSTSDFKITLREEGFRITSTRMAVLNLLKKSKVPLDVAYVKTQLKNKSINADQVTIYRMLDAFVEKGLINRLDFHEGKFRYELADSPHHHLICEQCGQIEDISDCPVKGFDTHIKKNKHFKVNRHALEFFGLCKKCQ